MLFATVFFWTNIKTSTQPINIFFHYHIKLAVHLYFNIWGDNPATEHTYSVLSSDFVEVVKW